MSRLKFTLLLLHVPFYLVSGDASLTHWAADALRTLNLRTHFTSGTSLPSLLQSQKRMTSLNLRTHLTSGTSLPSFCQSQ